MSESYRGLLGESLESGQAEREADLAFLAAIVDAFDQELDDAGLGAGGEGVPGLVELGQ